MAIGTQSLWTYPPLQDVKKPKGRTDILSSKWAIIRNPDGSATTGAANQPNATAAYCLITATESHPCGWVFSHWRLVLHQRDDTRPGGYIELVAESNEREHIVEIPAARYDGDWASVDCYPVYDFVGSNLIMRNANGDILRSNRIGDRILFDA